MNKQEFQILMQTVADGWNEGNARKAADCFSEDAIYSQPPNQQFYKGRDSLFEFFGGDKDSSGKMKMTWHNLFFNEDKQVGAGEYTFEMTQKNHGVTIVKIVEGKIKNWREYQWNGDLDFDLFLGENKF